MNGSIGSTLGSFMDLSVQRMVSKAASSPSSTDFARQLDAQFRERAVRNGLTLPFPGATPDTPPAPTVTGTDAATVDVLWAAAQRRELAAGHGPGDAIMQALSEAADARWNRRHGTDLFG